MARLIRYVWRDVPAYLVLPVLAVVLSLVAKVVVLTLALTGRL